MLLLALLAPDAGGRLAVGRRGAAGDPNESARAAAGGAAPPAVLPYALRGAVPAPSGLGPSAAAALGPAPPIDATGEPGAAAGDAAPPSLAASSSAAADTDDDATDRSRLLSSAPPALDAAPHAREPRIAVSVPRVSLAARPPPSPLAHRSASAPMPPSAHAAARVAGDCAAAAAAATAATAAATAADGDSADAAGAGEGAAAAAASAVLQRLRPPDGVWTNRRAGSAGAAAAFEAAAAAAAAAVVAVRSSSHAEALGAGAAAIAEGLCLDGGRCCWWCCCCCCRPAWSGPAATAISDSATPLAKSDESGVRARQRLLLSGPAPTSRPAAGAASMLAPAAAEKCDCAGDCCC